VAPPLAGFGLAGRAEARRVITAARAALASRCREVFATTNANPREVWLAPLGEGAELALFGLPHELRVSIEANYGYVLFVNGVPTAYGGVTPLFRQANTGVNVFPAFRGSEAAFLWTQMLRAFHTLFGVTRFVVNAVQFGEDNDEALASGAYWFYWRLGFRPASRRLAALAAREARRLAAHRSARTSPALLRKLATGDLHFTLPGAGDDDFFDELLLARCARLATRALARTGASHRGEAERILATRVAASLGVRFERWPRAERRAFTRMAPVVSVIPRLARWPAADRRAVATAMRAKGAATERDFALAAARAGRLFRTLRRAATALPDTKSGKP
ncbi:MAG: hypothetical protein U9Q74_13875, partial [Gemmatimonadota bacterium]|nr:hypothetical protein [Gemmatimonadota bacterium]